MKHFKIIVIIAVILLSFGSCGSNTKVFFSKDLRAKVCYELSGKEYTVLYTRNSGSESLEVVSPESLAGLSAVKKDGRVMLSFSDLTFPSVAEGIFAPFELFAECEAQPEADGIYKSKTATVYTDENMIPTGVFGNTGGKEYKLKILEFSEKGVARNE